MDPDDQTPQCHTHHGPVAQRPEDSADHAHHLHPAPHTHSVSGVEGHRPRQRRALLLSMGLTLVMMVVEFVGGLLFGSLMLLSDAVHMLSHAVSLGVSYLAITMAARPRTERSHYGLFRSEILGSLVNGLGMFLLSGWIIVEAIERLGDPIHVSGVQMVAIATIGLAVNAVTVWILARSGAEDLNTRSALLHMLGDLFSSVVIVAGGLVLILTGWTWLDPALSMLVAVLVLWWGIGLVRDSCSILLERAPRGVDPHVVKEAMSAEPGVRDVHDLHVWEITSGYICLTAHVVVDDARVSETDPLRKALCELLWHRFRVAHVTLQMEAGAV